MKKYISLDKRSKKAQKEYYAGFRRTWDGVNPETRIMPNGKAYNRKKDKEKSPKKRLFIGKWICSRFFYENIYEKSFIDICFISDKIG